MEVNEVAPTSLLSLPEPEARMPVEALDEIADYLLDNEAGTSRHIISVRYNKPQVQLRVVVKAIRSLPSLRRLHLAGTETADDEGLFVPQHALLGSLPSIQALQLDYVDLESMWEIKAWAPNVVYFGTTGCLDNDAPFRDSAGELDLIDYLNGLSLDFKKVKEFHISRPRGLDPELVTELAIMALIVCRRASSRTLDLDLAVHSLLSRQMFQGVANASNYTQLVRFLTLASLPVLFNLHLRGWVEGTGTSNLARISVDDLPTEAPLVHLLLAVLRKTTVMRLKLSNSIGHAESDAQCIFSREGNGEWKSRLARFW
ncbi:hypothetical protein RQP46_005821 [Phenoliferia psychrophenolica]